MSPRLICATLFCLALPAAAVCAAEQDLPLDPAQSAAIDRYVVAEMARERIPGAEVGIYRDGHSLLEKGYGLANVELKIPVDATTPMQSGSIGKQFVATAVMMLVEQGKVGLGDSIVKYFPDAPPSWRTIQVRNLLSHTSGLAEYDTHERVKPGGPFDLRMDFSEDELVGKIEALPVEFVAGEDWAYSNTNYVLLGILIHRVTGQSYGDYLHDKIFAPLGMDATRIISDRDIGPRPASGYEIDGGQLQKPMFVSATFNATGDGGLYLDVADLGKWDRALYGTTLVSHASLVRMWTPFVLDGSTRTHTGYGFGWAIAQVNGHRVIEHGGSTFGFTNIISRYVDDRLTVVVLTNLDARHAEPGYIERVIAGLVAPQLMPRPAGPIDDSRPEIARNLHATLVAMLGGKEVSDDFAADASAAVTPDFVAELRSRLPANWQDGTFVLMKRERSDGKLASVFRVGVPGDTRLVAVATDAAGKLAGLLVRADPDNR